MLIARKNNNLSNTFGPHKDEKTALEWPDIEEDDIDVKRGIICNTTLVLWNTQRD